MLFVAIGVQQLHLNLSLEQRPSLFGSSLVHLARYQGCCNKKCAGSAHCFGTIIRARQLPSVYVARLFCRQSQGKVQHDLCSTETEGAQCQHGSEAQGASTQSSACAASGVFPEAACTAGGQAMNGDASSYGSGRKTLSSSDPGLGKGGQENGGTESQQHKDDHERANSGQQEVHSCRPGGGCGSLDSQGLAPPGKEKSVLEASYRASLKLLTMAGVRLRQHCLARTVILSGICDNS